MSETNQEEPVYTKEQLEEMRQKANLFYQQNVEAAELELRYETAQAAISKARLERMMNEVRMAQLMAGPPKEKEQDPSPVKATEKKQLKKS